MEKIKDSTHPFKDRLANVMKLLDIKTQADFYRAAKIDPAQYYRVTDGFQNPGFGFLQKMAVAFPQLNIGWFLTGQGDIFLNPLNNKEKQIIENYHIKNYQIENVSPQPQEDVAFGLIKSIPEFI